MKQRQRAAEHAALGARRVPVLHDLLHLMEELELLGVARGAL